MKRGTVCPHLQTEGPRKTRIGKMIIADPRFRVKLSCLPSPILSHNYRTPGILCNDENFLGSQFAREEHNASFNISKDARPLSSHESQLINLYLSVARRTSSGLNSLQEKRHEGTFTPQR